MRMRRLSIWLLTSFIFVFMASPPAADAAGLDGIVKSGTLRVGMSGNQAPFNAKSRTGKLIGLEVDLANVLAGAMGVELKIVEKPFPDLLPALKAGEVDVVMSGMAITAERSLDVGFVGPYTLSGKSILTKSRLLAGAQEAGDINEAEIRLVTLENSTSQKFVEKNMAQAKLTTTKDYDAAVKMVLEDQADALVADMPICVLSVLRYPQDDLATLTRPFTIEPIGMALSLDAPKLRNLLDSYLTALEGTGILEQLRKKWLEDGSWVAALP